MRKLPEHRGLDRRHFLGMTGLVTVGGLVGRFEAAAASASPHWSADGAGMARIGLLVGAFDPNPETEVWAMAPRGVAIFASRIERGTLAFRTHLADPSHADVASGLLADLKLAVVMYSYSTTSYVIQLAGEDSFRKRIMERARADSVVLAAAALSDAALALKVQRVALVHPPWFPEEQSELGRAYFSSRGFEVVSCARIMPERRLSPVPAQEVYDWIVANTPPEAEAVVVAGNGLRAVGAIEALEASLGRPVITANQAMLWSGLRAAGVPARLERYGRLFRLEAARQ